MTRKDFVLIAKVLATAATEAYQRSDLASLETIKGVAADFATELKSTHPRFDADRFLKAALNEGLLL